MFPETDYTQAMNDLFPDDVYEWEPMPDDETGMVFDLRDPKTQVTDEEDDDDTPKSKRIKIVNIMVEQACRANKPLGFLRHYVRSMYRIQRARIATDNGQYALIRADRQFIDDADGFEKLKVRDPLPTDLADIVSSYFDGTDIGQRVQYMLVKDKAYLLQFPDIRTDKAYMVDKGGTGRKPTTELYEVEGDFVWMQEEVEKALLAVENNLEKQCKRHLDRLPVWTEYLEKIQGVGPRLGASLVGIIITIERFDTVSKLWKYCGYSTDASGNIQKRVTGEASRYHTWAKTTLFKAMESWIKNSRSQYACIYRDYKAVYAERDVQNRLVYDRLVESGKIIALKDYTDWDALEEAAEKRKLQANWMQYALDVLGAEGVTEIPIQPIHIHRRACRKTIKLFLSHLWEVWRLTEGLDIREPFAMEHMNHPMTSKIAPFVDHKEPTPYLRDLGVTFKPV